MAERQPKLELEKDKEYTVEIYPSKETVRAEYLGCKKSYVGEKPSIISSLFSAFSKLIGGQPRCNMKGYKTIDHVFAVKNNENKAYIFMNDHWIAEEDGRITYISFSSEGVNGPMNLSEIRSDFFPSRESSRLLKILKRLGEEI